MVFILPLRLQSKQKGSAEQVPGAGVDLCNGQNADKMGCCPIGSLKLDCVAASSSREILDAANEGAFHLSVSVKDNLRLSESCLLSNNICTHTHTVGSDWG